MQLHLSKENCFCFTQKVEDHQPNACGNLSRPQTCHSCSCTHPHLHPYTWFNYLTRGRCQIDSFEADRTGFVKAAAMAMVGFAMWVKILRINYTDVPFLFPFSLYSSAQKPFLT